MDEATAGTGMSQQPLPGLGQAQAQPPHTWILGEGGELPIEKLRPSRICWIYLGFSADHEIPEGSRRVSLSRASIALGTLVVCSEHGYPGPAQPDPPVHPPATNPPAER